MTTPTPGEPQDPIRVYLRIGTTKETCIGEIIPEIRMTEVNGNHAAVIRFPLAAFLRKVADDIEAVDKSYRPL
jgi:hypothetical protein